MASSVVADRYLFPSGSVIAHDDDSSELVGSSDSSLVSSSDSAQAEASTTVQGDARPLMVGGPSFVQEVSPLDDGRPQNLRHLWREVAVMPTDATPKSETPPMLIVRTYSVRRGRKSEYRVESETPDQCVERRIDDRKALRQHVARLMARHTEVCIDLSYHWKTLDQTAGARTALVPGLLTGGSDRQLCIDVSNHRVHDLREGAAVRYELGMNPKAWRRAVTDIEAAGLADALCKEFARVVREQTDMPLFSLVCHDQSLSTVINPLLKQLARHGHALRGLDRLDLNRYSRSAEISEARPGQYAGSEHGYFVLRLAALLGRTRKLRELCVRMSGLDAPALALLLTSHNQTLERLDLSGNPLCRHVNEGRHSLRGMRALARHLREESSLIELDLSGCGIVSDGADLLVRGLARNQVLQKLDLSGNPIPPSHPVFRDDRVRSAKPQAL